MNEQKLTYHVSLLVDHHPQVFEDVVDVHNIRLDRERQITSGSYSGFTELFLSLCPCCSEGFGSPSYLQLPDGQLPLLDELQVFLSDGLSLSLHLGIPRETEEIIEYACV